ncbi:MAG: PD-(D/E)XK nuclease family protein, partial [Planctomycetes bacterium]|nr:PD-(D/E)XK nuclease family protein [Planctomycetota bacterium]
ARAIGDAAHLALARFGPGMALAHAEDAFAMLRGLGDDALLARLAASMASQTLIREWPGAQVRLCEQPFVVDLVAGDDSRVVTGICDLLLRDDDGWHLFDYKTGHAAADPASHLQVACYAAMAAPHLDAPIRSAWLIDIASRARTAVDLSADAWPRIVAAWDARSIASA